MFKQITNLNGNEWYLVASLWIFLLFFIVVALMLIWMKKDHIEYMERMPLDDPKEEEEQQFFEQQNDQI